MFWSKKIFSTAIIGLIFVLYGCQKIQPFSASESQQTLPNNPQTNSQLIDSGKALFDETKWQVINKKSEDLEGNGEKEDIYLLKTIQPIGSDGFGEKNEYGVKILIAQNNEKLYEFTPSEEKRINDDTQPLGYYPRHAKNIDTVFFIDPGIKDTNESEEIAQKNTPRIMVQTEINGASDWNNCYNIIYYNVITHRFTSTNQNDFCEKFNIGIMFKQVIPGRSDMQILESLPANGKIQGNKDPQPFYITVYKWTGNTFEKDKKIPQTGSKQYENGKDAVEGELSNIKEYYKKTDKNDL